MDSELFRKKTKQNSESAHDQNCFVTKINVETVLISNSK